MKYRPSCCLAMACAFLLVSRSLPVVIAISLTQILLCYSNWTRAKKGTSTCDDHRQHTRRSCTLNNLTPVLHAQQFTKAEVLLIVLTGQSFSKFGTTKPADCLVIRRIG